MNQPPGIVYDLQSLPLRSTLRFSNQSFTISVDHNLAFAVARCVQDTTPTAWPWQDDDDDDFWPPDAFPPVNAGRVLGYLLSEAPVQDGANNIAEEIIACLGPTRRNMVPGPGLRLKRNELSRLGRLAYLYAITLLKAFKKEAGMTPYVYEHPSSTRFENARKTNALRMEKRKTGSKHKANALVRDGQSCPVSKAWDIKYYENNRNIVTGINAQPKVALTQAAHIIPQKLAEWHALDEDKIWFVSTIWTIFKRWGGLELSQIWGSNIDRVDNIISLRMELHDLFDTLRLWFTHQNNHTYSVEALDRAYLELVETHPVTFNSQQNLPAPKMEYLRLHRACVYVVRYSGAAEIADKLFRDDEEEIVVPAIDPQGAVNTGLQEDPVLPKRGDYHEAIPSPANTIAGEAGGMQDGDKRGTEADESNISKLVNEIAEGFDEVGKGPGSKLHSNLTNRVSGF